MLEKPEEPVLGRIISRYPILFSVLVSILLASAVYVVNNYFFYRSREFDKNYEAQIVFQGVQSLTRAGIENDQNLKGLIDSYINDIRANVTVEKSRNGVQVWKTWNGKQQDISRQMIKNEIQFEVDNSRYEIIYEYGNRPDMLLSVWRAFSFSIYDYVENSEQYWKYRFLNRSLPFWSYFLIIFFSVLVSVKKYKQDLQVIPLLQAHYNDKMTLFIDNSKEQLEIERDELVGIKGELEENGNELENLQKLYNISAEEKQSNSQLINELQKKNISLSEQKEKKDKLVEDYEIRITLLEDEKGNKEKEINELLEKTNELLEKIKNTEKMEHEPERDVSFKKIKKIIQTEYLSKSYKSGKKSEHCRADELLPWINKLKEEDLFVDVRNDSYEQKMQGTIKIKDQKDVGADGAFGELKIILKEDKGRSVICKFVVKKEYSNHIEKVGFVIAMLIRAKYKDLKDFKIKIV